MLLASQEWVKSLLGKVFKKTISNYYTKTELNSIFGIKDFTGAKIVNYGVMSGTYSVTAPGYYIVAITGNYRYGEYPTIGTYNGICTFYKQLTNSENAVRCVVGVYKYSGTGTITMNQKLTTRSDFPRIVIYSPIDPGTNFSYLTHHETYSASITGRFVFGLNTSVVPTITPADSCTFTRGNAVFGYSCLPTLMSGGHTINSGTPTGSYGNYLICSFD